jgi:cytochrome c oxidase assembly protein subunit 15
MIVVTGGAVRLTASGLGCPTWPKCTDDSLTNVPEQGIHGFIEFANRLLTFVLIIIALLTFIAIWRSGKANRKGLVWPSLSLGFGIFAQAIVGGISVLTNLNPWIVGLHFIVSTVLIAIASILVWRFHKPQHQPVPYSVYRLTPLVSLSGFVALIVGVVVTGAGPHAGDANAPRNGLDLEVLQHLHSYPGYISIGLTLITFLLLQRVNKDAAVSRATRITLGLLIALGAQALIGIVQARTGVPPILVGLHMLGASVVASLLTFQWLAVRAK